MTYPTITFEEYKSYFEQFSKIDSAEKLAFCKRQYDGHLLHLEDEQFFEPLALWSNDDIISDYERNLNTIFQFDKIKENQFYFLVIPSFNPEHMLTIECQKETYIMTLVTLSKNYWASFYADNKTTDVAKTTISAELSQKVGKLLFPLLNKTITDARVPKAKGFTLDGVKYWLSNRYSDGQRVVSKHSPDETSKSGKIIEIMQTLIDNIEDLNHSTLVSLEAKIKDIQD